MYTYQFWASMRIKWSNTKCWQNSWHMVSPLKYLHIYILLWSINKQNTCYRIGTDIFLFSISTNPEHLTISGIFLVHMFTSVWSAKGFVLYCLEENITQSIFNDLEENIAHTHNDLLNHYFFLPVLIFCTD